MPSRPTHQRLLGDTLTSFTYQILDEQNRIVDLTGMDSVKLFMRDLDGTVVLTPTAATVTDADEGEVAFDFPSGSVDESGEFLAYFQVDDGGEVMTYPATGILVTIHDPSATNTTPDPSVVTSEDIANLAKSPRRVRTVEGTVEERSVADLIKADQYTSAKEATAVPWGMRIAKTKPPSTLS